jgi:hypothetical protein
MTAPSSTAPMTMGNSSVTRVSRMPRPMVRRPRVAITVTRIRSGKRAPAMAPMVVPRITVSTLASVPIGQRHDGTLEDRRGLEADPEVLVDRGEDERLLAGAGSHALGSP